MVSVLLPAERLVFLAAFTEAVKRCRAVRAEGLLCTIRTAATYAAEVGIILPKPATLTGPAEQVAAAVEWFGHLGDGQLSDPVFHLQARCQEEGAWVNFLELHKKQQEEADIG